MSPYIVPVIMMSIANVFFWFKGNSKALYGIDWTPFRWWLTTSLFTNYLMLTAWWRLIEIGDVWKAGVAGAFISLIVNLILNTFFFGLNVRGIFALLLCALAGMIVHK